MLEVIAPDEDSARRVQPELNRIQRQRIESVIEELCSELSSPDRIHRIDLLEVDLGTLDFESLENELPGKLKPAMRKALSREIERQDSEARRNDDDPAITSQLELIAHFAATGTLPWWADSANPLLISEALDALIDRAPARFSGFLQQIVKDRDQLLRIVLHGNDSTLLRLQTVLSSALPSLAQALQLQTEAIASSWSYVPGADIVRVRNLFWLVQLRYVASSSAVADSVSHWQQVLARIATQSSEAFVSLIAGVLRAARTPHDETSIILTALLRDVFSDAQTREAMILPPALRTELLNILDEPKGEDPTPVGGAGDAGISTSPAVRQPESANQTQGAFDRLERLDLDFGDADTVYIENSGLVILWPFLPRFLRALGTGRWRQVQRRLRPASSCRIASASDH